MPRSIINVLPLTLLVPTEMPYLYPSNKETKLYLLFHSLVVRPIIVLFTITSPIAIIAAIYIVVHPWTRFYRENRKKCISIYFRFTNIIISVLELYIFIVIYM